MERDEAQDSGLEDDEIDNRGAFDWTKAAHVVPMDGGGLRCTHCGQSQAMALPCVIDVYLAAIKAFAKLHAGCKAPSSPRCTFCHAPDHLWEEHVAATCKSPSEWAYCGDVGASSRAIFHHFTTGRANRADVPLDPEDFGRCFRLLSAPWAKRWREQIGEMAAYPEWKPLVERWEELEKLYLEEKASGTAPKLWALMKQFRGE